MWENVERTGEREDANACILRVKYMLEGQYAEICPQKVPPLGSIGMHAEPGSSKPGKFQELPSR